MTGESCLKGRGGGGGGVNERHVKEVLPMANKFYRNTKGTIEE